MHTYVEEWEYVYAIAQTCAQVLCLDARAGGAITLERPSFCDNKNDVAGQF